MRWSGYSPYAPFVSGGRELSSYPDWRLQMERRILPGEAESTALSELETILPELAQEDSPLRRRYVRRPHEILSMSAGGDGSR
jgi:hypothetical protein